MRKLANIGETTATRDSKTKPKHQKNNPAAAEAHQRRKAEQDRPKQRWIWDTILSGPDDPMIAGYGRWEKIS
jgi:hypothetical protein